MIIGISKKIELAANLAIILVACLLAVALVKNYLITRTTASTEQAGTRQEENRLVSAPTLTSLNINWKESRQTLVLALSSTCHFCAESSPFYKKLIESKKDARIVAVLPEPVQHGRSYLEKLGLAVDEIKQSSLDTLELAPHRPCFWWIRLET